MRDIRIYCKIFNNGESFVLDKKNVHYLRDVLRIKSNQRIEVLTGDGSLYEGRFIDEGRMCLIKDIKRLDTEREILPIINIFAGFVKNNYFEYAIEKASELGATSITPVFCRYSSAGGFSSARYERFTKIAISSALQCRRRKPLEIREPVNIKEIFSCVPYGNNIFLDPVEGVRLLDDRIDFSLPFNIFSGPEGGFSEDEIISFKKNGFVGLSLGPNILKAETIPLVICSIILYESYRRMNRDG